MNRIFSTIAIGLIITSFQAQGQKLDKKKLRAESFFYTEKFDKARVAYEEVLSIAPSDNLSLYRVEICSLLTIARNKPLTKLESYAKTQGRKDKFYYYWMSKLYFQQNHFKKAIETSNKFIGIKQYRSKEIVQEIKDIKVKAEAIYTYYNSPASYEIEHLTSTVNTNSHESSPVYFREKEELLFLSSKPVDGSTSKEEVYHIYESKRAENAWTKPKLLKNLGNYSFENANIEVVKNDGKLFVYSNKGGGDLFYSELNGEKWSDLKEFDETITETKLESHFHINEQENRIFFAHRKQNKSKDLDLYQSIKNPSTGHWSKPSPVSANINSDQDEDYPFLSADEKTLYFSSKGHGAIGFYDIFKSEYDESTNSWSAPEMLKYPMNTPDNDIQFYIEKELNSGYFVSNRYESKGLYDIFFFHESDKVVVEGGVFDTKGVIMPQAEVIFRPKRSTGLLVKSMTDDDGIFSVTLGASDDVTVEIRVNEQIIHTETFSTPEASGITGAFKVDFKLSLHKESLEEEKETIEHLQPKYTHIEEIGTKFRKTNKARIGNIYFAVGGHALPAGAHDRLEALLETLQHNADLRFEISGHTDNQGAPEVNMTLSHKRAESVVAYLVSNGIDSKRLEAKGYGETRPLASNDDEENGRELNRRIEVAVME
jgi:outer membrane protein OmpA-like peptidoglycan-associated protein